MDSHSKTFQMLGQNLFASPPSNNYNQPQTDLNSLKYQQLLQMMDDQKQKVGDHNMIMKQREKDLFDLERQSQENQQNLVQQDRLRNQHNGIKYNQYVPNFNPQVQQQGLNNNSQQFQDQNIQQQPQQQYNQGFPTPGSQQYIAMSQNPSRRNIDIQQQPQTYMGPQNDPSQPQSSNQLNSIYQQIEAQNDYLKELSELIGKKPQNLQVNNDDSLETMMKMKADQKQQELLNELRELRKRVESIEKPQYPPPMPPPLGLAQPLSYNPYPPILNQNSPYNFPPYYQNPYSQYPPPFTQLPPPQQNKGSNDDDLTNELMLQLLKQQKRHNRNYNPRGFNQTPISQRSMNNTQSSLYSKNSDYSNYYDSSQGNPPH